jgi:hypothetical protein
MEACTIFIEARLRSGVKKQASLLFHSFLMEACTIFIEARLRSGVKKQASLLFHSTRLHYLCSDASTQEQIYK